MENRFDDDVVAITGASGGFGRRFVEEFRARGARVFCCDVNAEGLGQARACGATAQVVDVTDRAAVRAWVAGIEAAAGAIDVLVNNAGGHLGTAPGPVEDVSDAQWDGIVAANLGATFAVCRAAVPAMKRARKGRIINISSGAGIAASRTSLHPYTAAKHAIVGLTRQMAAELGAFGITVNSVAPGFVISSDHTRKHWDAMPDDAKRGHLETTFMRRVGEVDDVANAVLFLASARSSWISGQVLSVDGGVR
jgi:3-oxoacyl-[acyl-carrier protein] reductase